MPHFPQYQNALLVEGAKFTSVTGTTHSAVAGEVVLFSGTAAAVVTLPAVGQGGPVVVKNLSGGTTATIQVVTYEGSASHIDNIAGTTGVAVSQTQYDSATFTSDGSNWWRVFSL